MAFTKNKAATAEVLAVPDYPAVQPLEAKNLDDLRSMILNADKSLWIPIAGIYQAVIGSQAAYAARNVMDVDTWHAMIEEEVEYFLGKVAARSQKE